MVVKKPAIITSKEDGNFREALKLYDQKQYKKALKLVDANLKKNSGHSESLALKGCINFHNGHKEEAESYIVKALGKEPKNYLVDHLAGIYYRSVEKYPEATKWMKEAVDNGSPNKQVLRDLSILQSHVRDYKNLVHSRQAYLETQPGYRANWTAVAVAHHLNKDYNGAVSTLTKIEDIILEHLRSDDMFEHSECLLYKNQIIADSGNYAKALEVLEKDAEHIKDKRSFLEFKANYLLQLGQKKEASLVYRQLLKRNSDNYVYYEKLEESLELTDAPIEVRLKLYDKLSRFYPKSDPVGFLPLTFLPASHPSFKSRVENYVLSQLKRGVPATFVNVKSIYKDTNKLKVIENVVLDFQRNITEETSPTVTVWTKYFLAQHFLYLKDLKEALRYIDGAIDHTPTLVELYIVKARILKHLGEYKKASDVMNDGRLLDLQDRFINSKATKYFLRANKIDEAINCISLFTKLDDNAVNGCKDLHLMQVNWVLVESAEAYARLYKEYESKLKNLGTSDKSEQEVKDIEDDLQEQIEINKGLSIKRFQAVLKNFQIMYNDLYDFHSYCMRRGTPRDYVKTIAWENKLHCTPVYLRVLKGLSKIYFELYEQQQASIPTEKQKDERQRKNKKNKKQNTQLAKKRADLIAKVESEKQDADPLGTKALADLLSNKDGELIDKLLDYFKPLSEDGKDLVMTWNTLFTIYLLKSKYVLGLQAIKNLDRILNPSGTKKLKVVGEKLWELSEASKNDTSVNAAIIKVLEKAMASSFPEFSALSKEQVSSTYNE